MLSKELLEKVKTLGEEDKLQLVQLLIDDLKLVGSAYEVLYAIRQRGGSAPVAGLIAGDRNSRTTGNRIVARFEYFA